MLDWASLVAGTMAVFLAIYAVTGGADFGGGVWDLLASGPRAKRQRMLIATEIGPIWEANHVWLIVLIVLWFTCFPRAFASLTTDLHVPLSLMLLGIVFRGTAFVFRTYDRGKSQQWWGRLFALASTLTPVMLGICLGVISAGPDAESGGALFWVRPFPIATGLLALCMFAFLAAVYLAARASEPMLKADFVRRAMGAGILTAVMAWLCLAIAATQAPHLAENLIDSFWALPFHLFTGLLGAGALIALWRGIHRWPRILAAAQVVMMVLGWALAVYPYLIFPDHTIYNAGGAENVMKATLAALAFGGVLLMPSFYYLFKVFSFRPGEN